eukprot:scaffold3054_cov129-Cylindrotheca_fusiformis.AAC.23
MLRLETKCIAFSGLEKPTTAHSTQVLKSLLEYCFPGWASDVTVKLVGYSWEMLTIGYPDASMERKEMMNATSMPYPVGANPNAERTLW